MTNPEKKRQANALLENPRAFACQPASDRFSGPLATSLAPELRAFFDRFEEVRTQRGETRLARSLVARSALNPQLIRIGTDLEFTEIAVLPLEERILQIDPHDPSIDDDTPANIHEFLVEICEALHPDGEGL